LEREDEEKENGASLSALTGSKVEPPTWKSLRVTSFQGSKHRSKVTDEGQGENERSEEAKTRLVCLPRSLATSLLLLSLSLSSALTRPPAG